jgi:Co/Zn/Cd efflux system component
VTTRTHGHGHAHAHTHGLVDRSIRRSREGLGAVALALGVLALTAVAQAVVFVASGSVALLADLIHNVGDATTALPLGVAFALPAPAPSARRAASWCSPSSRRPVWPGTRPPTG